MVKMRTQALSTKIRHQNQNMEM